MAIALLALGGYGVYISAGSSGGLVVPKIQWGDDLEESFSALRALKLKVSINFVLHGKTIPASCLQVPQVDRISPIPGTPIKRGHVVTLIAEAGDIASDVGPPLGVKLKHYRAPRFIGRPASAALGWANRHHMCWSLRYLPSVVGSGAHDLYSAHRVTAQDPAPRGVITEYDFLEVTVKPRR